MEQDKELKAISDILNAIESLDQKSRESALNYVLSRLNIKHEKSDLAQNKSIDEIVPTLKSQNRPNELAVEDIRTLKNQKNPVSNVQMAVLLAYYLKEKAPNDERSEIITGADILKYFPQAGYPIPEGKYGTRDTLNNAKKAGYLEAAGGGAFKLNAVGYNLAAFKMGQRDENRKKTKQRGGRKRQ
jgi:hypothetical protein